MIKDLETIQHHKLRDDIWQMLIDHREFQNVCRYTMAEVQRYADHLRRLSWTTNIGAPQFMERFNLTEKSIIEFFAGSVTRADKVEAWERKHKSSVQKCQRLTADIISYCEKTQTLRAELEAHRSRRL